LTIFLTFLFLFFPETICCWLWGDPFLQHRIRTVKRLPRLFLPNYFPVGSRVFWWSCRLETEFGSVTHPFVSKLMIFHNGTLQPVCRPLFCGNQPFVCSKQEPCPSLPSFLSLPFPTFPEEPLPCRWTSRATQDRWSCRTRIQPWQG
jgi:hypothetical protein